MPGPNRSETIHKRHIFPKVGIQPETGRHSKVCNAEEDDTEDSHEEKQTQETKKTPTKVVDTLSQLQWPQGIENYDEDQDQCQSGIQLALHLAAFPKPHVVHVVTSILLLLNANVPLAFCSLGFLAIGSFFGFNLADSQSKHA